eukprot:SAG11_NODE_11582_length_751_cov_0.788344_2_plen_93_part_01
MVSTPRIEFTTSLEAMVTAFTAAGDAKASTLQARPLALQFDAASSTEPPLRSTVTLFFCHGNPQDLLAGRPFEKDAIVTAVQDIARAVHVATP